MNPNVVNVSVGLSVSTLVALFATAIAASRRFGALELKVNTMWDFQMRRAFSEVNMTGLAVRNSPLRFTPDAMSRLDPIKPALVAFWKALDHPIEDGDMLLEIERKFGAELISMVCVPCGLSHGACLLLALSVAKGDSTVMLVQGVSTDDN